MRVICCSATIGNPRELAEQLTGAPMTLIDNDGSPRGRRTYLLWNPPRLRDSDWRSRRSANVEAHELMARLIERGLPTITFSKAKMTAEMIHRYVTEKLRKEAPGLAAKVSPYRGGYLPEERREIERRLFSGELLGVSTTPALELGIDVGGLDASIVVGYPGTLASFFQQTGRAGRQSRDALAVLIGLDTSINQFIMSHPDYLFGRAIEQAVVDRDNPFVITGHLRCAAHELPLADREVGIFGPYAGLVLEVLEGNRKVRRTAEHWYHAAPETPQHEISLRAYDRANVVIQDAESGAVLGEMIRLDAPALLHPEAIYMHLGDTYRVLTLDLDKNVARVQRVDTDYYTQPLGGTDVHHVDHRLREKPFGTGAAYWGEVTAYFNTGAYEKIHFYSLDAISRHPLQLPTFQLETMALWIVPPEPLMEGVRDAGLDAHSGLRGIGYATRMLLPLFMTCDTLDFSHSIGSVNSEWNAIFIYERYPHGLGFTEKAYELLHRIMPAVLDAIRKCPCAEGCPCCVGKPLRQFTTWNVERYEASIPSKTGAIYILERLLGDGANLENPDKRTLTDSDEGMRERLQRALRRRLERMREPEVFHPIEPRIATEYPEREKEAALEQPDAALRSERRRSFDKDLRKRLAKRLLPAQAPPTEGEHTYLPAKARRGVPGGERLPTDPLPAGEHLAPPPEGMKTRSGNLRPSDFPGRPSLTKGEEKVSAEDERRAKQSAVPPTSPGPGEQTPAKAVSSGDPLAARAKRLLKKHGEQK